MLAILKKESIFQSGEMKEEKEMKSERCIPDLQHRSWRQTGKILEPP
jgi:hypothetical protein